MDDFVKSFVHLKIAKRLRNLSCQGIHSRSTDYAILELRLYQLTGMERGKIEEGISPSWP